MKQFWRGPKRGDIYSAQWGQSRSWGFAQKWIWDQLSIIKRTEPYKKVLVKILISITLNDDKTYKLLQAGDTTEYSSWSQRTAKRYSQRTALKFEDRSDSFALYRPGPMQFIDGYPGETWNNEVPMEKSFKNT